MNFDAPAILLVARAHGETAVIAQLFTETHGIVAAYIAGGRGRRLRPILVPGNVVAAELRAKSEGRLPFARLELVESRGPWLAEPLAAAGIDWAVTLTAAALPEREPFPQLYSALGGLLDAICNAPSARGWASALVGYEALLLHASGYGGAPERPAGGITDVLAAMDRLSGPLETYCLAGRRGDVMAARARLRTRLSRLD